MQGLKSQDVVLRLTEKTLGELILEVRQFNKGMRIGGGALPLYGAMIEVRNEVDGWELDYVAFRDKEPGEMIASLDDDLDGGWTSY